MQPAILLRVGAGGGDRRLKVRLRRASFQRLFKQRHILIDGKGADVCHQFTVFKHEGKRVHVLQLGQSKGKGQPKVGVVFLKAFPKAGALRDKGGFFFIIFRMIRQNCRFCFYGGLYF
ncbi:hypothetical protein SDC9_142957 [bioreactor metagenome]|uniref:Uncharacterized protein n=1 Tax=bioreactor metagenome TaxID=1076179 RepID=A0A645E5F3_9ZZZZ